jgi:predicted ATPase with chaperone activity
VLVCGTDDGGCECTPGIPERYVGRVSGPLRDRIDLWVTMPKVRPAALVGGPDLPLQLDDKGAHRFASAAPHDGRGR